MIVSPVKIPNGAAILSHLHVSAWWSHLPVSQVEPPFYLFSLLMVVPPVDIPGEGSDFIRSISSWWSHLWISQVRVATLSRLTAHSNSHSICYICCFRRSHLTCRYSRWDWLFYLIHLLMTSYLSMFQVGGGGHFICFIYTSGLTCRYPRWGPPFCLVYEHVAMDLSTILYRSLSQVETSLTGIPPSSPPAC